MKPSLDDLAALALAAGQEIMAVRTAGFEAMKKGDGSPVTIADQRAEAVIEEGLKRIAPDVPMIGEESVAEGRIPDPGARFWCVDPLDGTRDFVAGQDEFTVNIALIEDGVSTYGVVLMPMTGEMFVGEPGHAKKAVFDLHDGRITKPFTPIHTTRAKPADGQWRVYASKRLSPTGDTQLFLNTLKPYRDTHMSSSIKFCRLAEGVADLYPRFGDVSEWDAAAGNAVLSAAGGGVMRLNKTPLRYGSRDTKFLVPGFVAYANAEAEAAAKAGLKS